MSKTTASSHKAESREFRKLLGKLPESTLRAFANFMHVFHHTTVDERARFMKATSPEDNLRTMRSITAAARKRIAGAAS